MLYNQLENKTCITLLIYSTSLYFKQYKHVSLTVIVNKRSKLDWLIDYFNGSIILLSTWVIKCEICVLLFPKRTPSVHLDFNYLLSCTIEKLTSKMCSRFLINLLKTDNCLTVATYGHDPFTLTTTNNDEIVYQDFFEILKPSLPSIGNLEEVFPDQYYVL